MTNFISYVDGGKTGEQGWYDIYTRLFTPGVATIYSTTAWQVTQRGAGANMSVDIAVGGGSIGISTSTYNSWGFSDGINNLSVTAADPSNPRKDIVVAYRDLAIIDSTTANNPNALKFKVVAGTPAGSPSDPSDATIQAAVGASNPWIKLGRILVGAGVTSILTANITDLRRPIGWMGNLYGGASNTNGHTVPNTADDTVALLAAVQSFTNKSFDSTNTLTAPKFRSIDAWVDANESWTYASATTITVPSDATTKYDVGDFIKLTQSATVKYFIVTAVSATVLTVAGMNNASPETVANSPISANYYSKARSPHGLPGGASSAGAAWSPTVVGWASTTAANAYYIQNGKIVTLFIDYAGTSNSTAVSFTLPVPASAKLTAYDGACGGCLDNGAAPTNARWTIQSSTGKLSISKDMTGSTPWTASGTKSVRCVAIYEAA